MFKIIKDNRLKNTVNTLSFFKRQQRRAQSNSSQDIVSSADVVIIGGGIAGCNTLYQLTKRGVNAVLLERSKLTSGTTWHTAGLVWSLRPCDLEVKLLQDSRTVYSELEKESGDYAGWINNGGLFISRSKVRTQEYMRLHTLGKALGQGSQLLDSHEAQKIFPILDPSVFQMALYAPQDGTIDPAMACAALVKMSKKNGGKVYEDCPVLDIHYSHNMLGNKEVTGVHTDKGFIRTKCVVNCGGAWGPRIARYAGVPALPLVPFKHAYVVCDALPEMRGCPNLRDHDVNLYLKVQGETVSIGGYEGNPHILDQVPDNLQFHLYELDWDVFGVHMTSAATLCPKLGQVGVKSTVCGPESFTPDHKPLLGEDTNVFGLYHNCGYNSAGMMFSAGCGIQMAEWIVTGRPRYNMFTFDVRRFTTAQLSRAHWVRESSHEAYAKNYSIVFPHDESLAGRDASHDALHQELVDDGAVMQARAGWERPAFFIPGEKIRVQQYDWGGNNDYPRNLDQRYEEVLKGDYTFDFSKHHALIGNEALACRNGAALFDMSYYGKFYLTGPDARRTAELAFTADLSKSDDRVVYSLMLNNKGGVEADVTVSILDGGSGQLHEPIFKGRGYYIVASGFSATHVLAHLRKIVQMNQLRANITDVTKQLCILSVQGPNSQRILQRYTDAGLANDAFPVSTHRSIRISKAADAADGKQYTCRALRIGWAGELGWELHVPSSHAIQVTLPPVVCALGPLPGASDGAEKEITFQPALVRADGIKNSGWRALTSLSAEKGYHLWNADLRTDDNPIEANLGFTCRNDGEYIGNEQVTRARKEGVTKKYAYFTLNEKIPLFGQEAIFRNGEVVGYLRRGEYAYYLDKPIGIGYVNNEGDVVTKDYLKDGDYEIEVMGKKYKATVHLKSPFDPTNQRILGNYGELGMDENTHEPHAGQNERAGGSE
ncbi:Sarcosine dehydrogenase, mitochondrial [Eumeta japonica]|uniref:Sarcosine dehydrogenase, mitochondrial n=1 Tax=Eumeta variegata TaxID=151549 RepID=A0A4C1YUG1_EUMVA|nr:Sarcosine dehydrogenase, mitochondrial [Eumeta japonica]